jgi:outer membrane protein, multidrug efflux system
MKHTTSLVYTFFIISIAFLLSSCAAWKPKIEDRIHLNAPPTAYQNDMDSAQIRLSWRSLLTDKNLAKLIDTALARNYDRKIALTNIEMSMAEILRTQAPLVPQVQGVAIAGAERFGEYTMNGVGNYDLNKSDNITRQQRIPTPFMPDMYVGLRTSWEIDIWGRLKNQRAAALERLLAQRDAAQWLTTNIIAQVATLYYELLALDEEQKITDENILLQEKALDIVIIQKEAGRATELAVQQFKAQVHGTRALRFQLQQRIAQTENAIRILLGQYNGIIERSTNWEQQVLPAKIQAGLPARLLSNRPDIRQAERELAATKLDLAVAKAAFLPSLTLSPTLGLQSFRPISLLTPSSAAVNLLSGLSMPLFNKRGIEAERNVRTAKQDEAFFKYQQQVIKAYNEVQLELQQFNNLQQGYRFKTDEVAALRRAVEVSNDLYTSGYANYLEVISAQKGVLLTSLELIEMRKMQYVNIVNVYRVLGGEQ